MRRVDAGRRVRAGVPVFVGSALCPSSLLLVLLLVLLSSRSAHAASLMFSVPPPTASATATAPLLKGPFTLHGPVYMGTGNVQVTEDLTYTLSVFRGDPARAAQNSAESVTEAYTAVTHIDAQGEYSFSGVPLQPGDLYVVTTTYGGITQGTAPATFDGRSSPEPSPITLFAGTSDTAKIVIAQAQQLISFPAQGVMQVTESMTIVNQGDRFVLTDVKTPDGRPIAISFPLPIGARGITFTTRPTDRFTIGGSTNMPVVQDTKAVLPGKAQDVIYTYQIPYAAGAPIDRDFLYPVNSLKITLPADAGVGVRGQSFTWSRADASDTGRALDIYTLDPVPLKDGKRLIYTLDGAAQSRASATGSGASGNGAALFAIGASALVVLFIGLAVFWLRARARLPD